jgi:hypothetical protein
LHEQWITQCCELHCIIVNLATQNCKIVMKRKLAMTMMAFAW